jgi:hypothetical protein
LILGMIVLACLLVGGLGAGAVYYWLYDRPQPKAASQQLFQGVSYERQVIKSPRPMVVHVVTVDLKANGVRLLVTPGKPNAEEPLQARTTSGFLQEFGVQVAVNGDGFTPWYSNSLFNYYPHVGEPVTPVGFAASQGKVYSQGTGAEPVLYISRTNRASFNNPIGAVYNAIAGNIMLVAGGRIQSELIQSVSGDVPQPRTALALDKSGRRLMLIVVDGRQPSYSQGATLEDLAGIITDHGGFFGMNLDGGGSSTLVMEGKSGRPRLLNSPIDNQIPGRERPVGNHLGIFAQANE